MALVVAQEVPTSSTMALPHGPTGVGAARHRLRRELTECGTPEPVVDDAVLILSELLSNSCLHARPLDGGDGERLESGRAVRVSWQVGEDGLLTLEVTDGGGPTRPMPSSPSLTARGGRGLGIVRRLAAEWGVRDAPGEVTVWAVLAVGARHARTEALHGGLVGGLDIAPNGQPVDFDGAFD